VGELSCGRQNNYQIHRCTFAPDRNLSWLAKLRIDESNVGKGALIGTGVGFGVGFIAAGILASQCEGCPPHGFALFPIGGAVIGALLATRWKKKT
jgi:hypothetical protein